LIDGFERCQRLGIQHCLTKPVKAAELLEAVQASLERRSEQADDTSADTRKQNSTSLHVLVADDSPVNQEVTAGLLALRGHTVQTADDGREAVEAFFAQKFDIVFMDVEMPEMDGLTAARRIRELEKQSEGRVPILAMTAHVLNSIKMQCLDAGMDGYISKPIQPDELYEALEIHCPAKESSAAK
jgi:CheY-like chemotaxis protein